MLFLVLFVSLSSQAHWTDLTADDFSVPAMPGPRSQQNKLDFKLLHQYQDTRTKDECELARHQTLPTFKAFFGPSAKLLSQKEFSALQTLMNKVGALTESITHVFKKEYERPRPYDEDETLKPCAVKPGGHKSYPSSHASIAATQACILAKVFPQRSQKFLDYGKFLGDLRAIVGVHHPSDVIAGQHLGKQICEKLFTKKSFNRDLHDALH